ncbi:MAG: NADP-dependent malic enzyme [marine benthic group bacterium]|jgi:malate dehydrogenase (oxaloacetate-decarboxylating)(NADP+)|nr:NADP-dependent malic enzyme [Candidatus Carthagonibacter metallireducens]MCL7982310.1 NADP-dependent malic enzyme [Gemmatimonadota bacterium]
MEVIPTKPCATQWDLSLAYTPGVAEPCREIDQDVENVYKYTARGNLVAVVSNGTAILGLGDLGPEASKPVMEGKGVLFKRFADIDVFDLEIKADTPADVIRFCEMLEPTVGGINLEDIHAPDCFEIEQTLKERLDIPVFHDDQHGTAIISGAALINALELADKKIDEVRVVFSGAGAAAIATAWHYERLGAKRENLWFVDSKGVINTKRDNLTPEKARYAVETDAKTLAEAVEGADVFIGLSIGGLMKPEMVASMARDPIVFAMANPDPEILPEDALAVRDDVIMATGRSDYPNQVNNVLGFPFIFRGALDVRASTINDEMFIAATMALAELAKEDVPESVSAAYEGRALHFGRDYLIPTPFDTRVLLWEASAVAQAAMDTGVARKPVDIEDYKRQLEARLGPARELMRSIMDRAKRTPKRIVLPEGEEPVVVRASHAIVEEGLGTPILLGRPDRIREVASANEVDLEGVEILDPRTSEKFDEYVEAFFDRRHRKGITIENARSHMQQPIYYAAMMVERGDAHTLIGGANMSYPDSLRPALQTIDLMPGIEKVVGLYMLLIKDRLYFFADTTVNIDPDAEILAETAEMTADFVRRLGIEPYVAMLSFSNFGSAPHPSSEKVRQAVRLIKERRPDIIVDGEMQADTAVVKGILESTYPFSDLKRPANVLIFPDLSAANASYKLLNRLGGAEAIGPVLLGLSKPVHLTQRGATMADITNLAAISVVDAEQRKHQDGGAGGS